MNEFETKLITISIKILVLRKKNEIAKLYEFFLILK